MQFISRLIKLSLLPRLPPFSANYTSHKNNGGNSGKRRENAQTEVGTQQATGLRRRRCSARRRRYPWNHRLQCSH
ncbi:hypothetical protein COP1_021475 [Malus domestica]